MHPSSGVQTAFDFVRENLEKGTWRPGSQLPAIKELSLRCGVGSRTMFKAVAELKQKGFLSGVRGGKLRAGSSGSQAAGDTAPRSTTYDLKRAEIENDILLGRYARAGKLPRIKELQARYGACYHTMRRILVTLAAGKVIQIRNKEYRLPERGAKISAGHVLFITPAFPLHQRSALNPEEYRVIDTLERECVRSSLKLDILEIDFGDSGLSALSAMGALRDQSVLGIVLDLWWYSDREYQRSYLDLLARLARHARKPIALLDELGDFVMPIEFSANPLLQVFRFEGKSCGSRMARLLLNLRHRSVAYISHTSMGSWSRHRFEGAQALFDATGQGHHVYPYMIDLSDDYRMHILALSGFDEPTLRKAIVPFRTKRQQDALLRAVLNVRGGKELRRFEREDVRALRKILAPISDVAHGTSDMNALQSIYEAVMTKADEQIGMMLLTPLFDQALGRREVTAWICSSDNTALMAMRYLRERGRRVPRDLSLVGFDNLSLKAIQHRLTTFDFNTPAVMYRILDFITRPPRPRDRYRHMPIEVEGIVMERDTTGAPRPDDRAESALAL